MVEGREERSLLVQIVCQVEVVCRVEGVWHLVGMACLGGALGSLQVGRACRVVGVLRDSWLDLVLAGSAGLGVLRLVEARLVVLRHWVGG